MNALTSTENMTPAANPTMLPATKMGFSDLPSFEFMQRTAKMFASSSMVPVAYQSMVTKGYGENQTTEHNPAAIPNCMIALDMSQRMNANALMIMQNLHVIEGRPSWSSQFIIAAINNCGKFSPLRFDLQWLDEMDASYSTYEWKDRKKVEVKQSVRIKNARCVAWAIEKATGERLESAPVTMEMAVAEGWFGKNGSKWKSMPDLMMRYRSAAFFGRIYAPELLMGLPASDEVRDILDVEQQSDGSYAMPGKPPAPATPVKVQTPQTKATAAAQQDKVVDVEARAEAKTSPQGPVDQQTGEVLEGSLFGSPSGASRGASGAKASEGERKRLLQLGRKDPMRFQQVLDSVGFDAFADKTEDELSQITETGGPEWLEGLSTDQFIAARDFLKA